MERLTLCFIFIILSSDLWAQSWRKAEGKVIDINGMPVAGATVVAENTGIGTITDIEGKFSLNIPENVEHFRISFVGMEPERVVVKPFMQVVLRGKLHVLEEMLVVAYGKAQRRSFTGAAVTVSDREFEHRPLTVVTSALDGVMAGVQVAEGNGQPGSEVHLRIRGFGSVNADNEPVYVVDGAIFQGALCDLNPADIESLTVLKDAASAALYGSSAGNGVVLITTKSARQDKPSLTFSVKQGFSERGIPEYDRVSLREYYPLQWEMIRNGLVTEGVPVADAAKQATAGIFEKVKYNPFRGIANDQIVLPDGRLNPQARDLLYGDDLDWEKAVSRKGYRGEYNIAYGQRNTKGDFYATLGYLKEMGYVRASGLERFSGRIRGSLQPLRWLKTGLSLNVTRTNCHLANTQDNASDAANPFYFTRYIGPVYPIHQHNRSTGAYITDSRGNALYDYEEAERGTNVASLDRRNIVAETRSNRNYFERNGINGRLFGELYFLPGLKGTVNLMVDAYDYRREKYENNIAASSPGRIEASSIRTTAVTATELLNYDYASGRHRMEVLAGHESYAYQYEYLYGNKQDQFLDGVYEMYNFQTLGRLNSYTDIYRKEGYLMQLVYGYDQRYHVSVAYRRDGSSRFRQGQRWGNFWSVGMAWQMNKEFFLQNKSWINSLKVRLSYGITGNGRVLEATSRPNTFSNNYYPWQSFYKLGTDNGEEPGIALATTGNRDLKWETQATWDAAVEFRFWDWLSGSVEYFRKEGRDLLFEQKPPLSSGKDASWANVGKIGNRGIELTFQGRLVYTRHWKWTMGVNATFLRNQIRQMPPALPELVDGTRKLKAGQPLYNFWLKEYRGVDPQTGDALFAFDGKSGKWNERYCQVNERGDSLTYNSTYARYHYAGSPVPKVYGGVNTALQYKNMGLAVVWAYSVGGKVYNTGYQVLMYSSKYGQAFHRDILKRWQQPGDRTDVPRLDDTGTSVQTGLKPVNQTNATSDRWLFDAGYLSLRSVTIDYRLPERFLRKYGVGEAKVFLSGENLYLLTALKGMDPRQAYKGLVTVDYTPARTFTFGLTFTI